MQREMDLLLPWLEAWRRVRRALRDAVPAELARRGVSSSARGTVPASPIYGAVRAARRSRGRAPFALRRSASSYEAMPSAPHRAGSRRDERRRPTRRRSDGEPAPVPTQRRGSRSSRRR